jgi:glutamyl-tRNA reductase
VSATSCPDVELRTGGHRPQGIAGALDEDATPLRLVGLEFSLETATLDTLERVTRSITPRRLSDWFRRCDETLEAGMVSTCHRAELLLLLRSPGDLDRWRDLLPGTPSAWRVREGRDAVHHVFRVAAGWESLARGEGEVRYQIRAARARVESRHPRPVLRDLLGRAADAADELHSGAIAPPSIGAVASERLLALVDRPQPRVLVIGSGIVGRQVAETLAGRAQVTMLYHRHPPNVEFLRETGARTNSLERIREELARADAAVTAAKFGDRGLRVADLPPQHPLLLIDLGMPRNIDPDVRALPNVRLVDLETLYARRGETPEGLDLRLEELADQCAERLDRALREPWITALRRAAEELRQSELERARHFLGPVPPDQEAAIDRLTRRLMARLLRAPTERLRSLPAGPEGDLQRRWALELFRPLPPDP